MLDARKIGMALVGRVRTQEQAVRAAVVNVMEACDPARGVAEGEAFLVLELAWQRVAQEERARALAEGGAEAFAAVCHEQRQRLRVLDMIVADAAPSHYRDGRWLGSSETVVAAVRMGA